MDGAERSAAIDRIMDLAAEGDPRRLFYALQQALGGLVFLTATDDGLRQERLDATYRRVERALRGEWP